MEKFQITDVFTPTKPAQLTFIERENINNKLVEALQTPGKQIIVYGHSGSGKSTLLVNKLKQIYEEEVITRCTSTMTYEQLLIDAFDQLAPFYISAMKVSSTRVISGSIEAQYLGIKSRIESKIGNSLEQVKTRILPPQLTPQRLAAFLGEVKCCWVLEDFHKIETKEKKKLSQIMKVFMDLSMQYSELKIIAIGAVGTAREIVQLDVEMKNRVAEILIPLMSKEELLKIINKGAELLNLKFTNEASDQIVQYSNGLPSICHQLCLNCCFSLGITETLNKKIIIDEKTLEKAILSYIDNESDTIKSSFEKAFKQKKTQKFNNCELILNALSNYNFEDGATVGDIFKTIKRKEAGYPRSNLTNYLTQLQTNEYGSIISFNKDTSHYIFSNPFYRVFAMLIFKKDRIDKDSKDTFDKKLKEAIRKNFEDLFQTSLNSWQEITLIKK